MDGLELMWAIFEWLPLVFAVDLVVFHVVGDHPLALQWWVGRSSETKQHSPGPAGISLRGR